MEKQLTQEEVKLARTLGLRRGDPNAAMSLFICYLAGKEGYPVDLDLAKKYLHYAARLCHPEALHIITDLYGGGSFGDMKLEKNVLEQVKYLKMLCCADQIVDMDTINHGQDKEKFLRYEWDAYATLGRLYIMDESLDNLQLGYAISLKLAEENGIGQSLFSMGWYWFYVMGSQYYETALPYFERAIHSGDTFWGKQAVRYYNSVAEEANDRYRGPNGQIPYYE